MNNLTNRPANLIYRQLHSQPGAKIVVDFKDDGEESITIDNILGKIPNRGLRDCTILMRLDLNIGLDDNTEHLAVSFDVYWHYGHESREVHELIDVSSGENEYFAVIVKVESDEDINREFDKFLDGIVVLNDG